MPLDSLVASYSCHRACMRIDWSNIVRRSLLDISYPFRTFQDSSGQMWTPQDVPGLPWTPKDSSGFLNPSCSLGSAPQDLPSFLRNPFDTPVCPWTPKDSPGFSNPSCSLDSDPQDLPRLLWNPLDTPVCPWTPSDSPVLLRTPLNSSWSLINSHLLFKHLWTRLNFLKFLFPHSHHRRSHVRLCYLQYNIYFAPYLSLSYSRTLRRWPLLSLTILLLLLLQRLVELKGFKGT